MIQPPGLAVLDALGVGDVIRQLAAPIRGLHGVSMPSGRLALAMSYDAIDANTTAYGVHRSLLFTVLFDAVRAAGIPVDTAHSVCGSQAHGDRRTLLFENGSTSPPCDLVVDAMGVRSPLSTQSTDLRFGALWTTLDRVDGLGIVPDRLDQRYRHAVQMAGVMPLGRSGPGGGDSVAYFWSLRTADVATWRTAGLEAWRAEATRLWPQTAPLLDQIRDARQFVFAAYQHRTLLNPVATALAHVGDAWHAASPQLGQGANMALLDAHALHIAVSDAPSVAAGLTRYQRRRQAHVRLYQLMSRVFTPAFQSDSRALPWLRDRVMAPLDRVPAIRRLTARIVAGQIWLGTGP